MKDTASPFGSLSFLAAPPAGPASTASNTFVGTDRADSIGGTNFDDQINARGGDDYIYPYGGNDSVIGGDGLDVVSYQADYADLAITYSALTGRFTITDNVAGRWGTDNVSSVEFMQLGTNLYVVYLPMSVKTAGVSLFGGEGNDTVQGGPGGDSLLGGPGDDRLAGGGGNDLLVDHEGSNTAVFSGRFSDYTIGYTPSTGLITVTDRVAGRDGTDTLFGVWNAQFSDGERWLWDVIQLYGTSDNDIITGSASDNIVYGWGGHDVINGGRGDDIAGYYGSYADYTVTFNSATGVYTVTDLVAFRDGVDTLQNVEYLQFSDGRIPIGTSAGGQYFGGTDGNDSLVGGPGDDSLYGGKGANVMTGLEGHDLISGNGGSTDTAVYRGNFADYVITWDEDTHTYSVADKVAGRDGKDLIYYVERLQFADGTIDTITSPGGLTLTGSEVADNLRGDAGPDHVEGAGGDDTLGGGGGNDVLLGGAGADSLDGGADDDRLTGGPGDDRLQGRNGVDTAIFSGNFADYLIQVNTTNGNLRVTDNTAGRDGIDSLSAIEKLQFADGTWTVQSALPADDGSGVELVGAGSLLSLDGA